MPCVLYQDKGRVWWVFNRANVVALTPSFKQALIRMSLEKLQPAGSPHRPLAFGRIGIPVDEKHDAKS